MAVSGCSAAISRADGRDPKETTHRTRSFLYASLGAIFAERLGLRDVYLADNGVVSINLPINAQLSSTLSSRSTHPKFLRLFNTLIRAIFDDSPIVTNPLWSRTRTETLDVLKGAGLASLVVETVSCSHNRFLQSQRLHCGVCSQCVDRRFATAAAGLEDEDPPEKYMVDIFKDSLAEGDPRTMVLSYHGFALDILKFTAEGLFEKYSQLFDCVQPGPNQKTEAQTLVDMFRRHAETVIQVTEDQIEQAKGQLARRELPLDCLISLLGSGGSQAPPKNGFHQPRRRPGRPKLDDDTAARNLYEQGEALRAKHAGITRAQIAANLGLPVTTYKRYVRVFRANA